MKLHLTRASRARAKAKTQCEQHHAQAIRDRHDITAVVTQAELDAALAADPTAVIAVTGSGVFTVRGNSTVRAFGNSTRVLNND